MNFRGLTQEAMVLNKSQIFIVLVSVLVASLLIGCKNADGNAVGVQAGAPKSTTPQPGGLPSDGETALNISGAFSFSLSADPDKVLAHADARKVIEEASVQAIAQTAKVHQNNITIDSIIAGNTSNDSLIANQRMLKVGYTITIDDQNTAIVVNSSMSNMSKSDFKVLFDSAISTTIGLLSQGQQTTLQAKIGTLSASAIQVMTTSIQQACQPWCTRPKRVTKQMKLRFCANWKCATCSYCSTTTTTPTPPSTCQGWCRNNGGRVTRCGIWKCAACNFCSPKSSLRPSTTRPPTPSVTDGCGTPLQGTYLSSLGVAAKRATVIVPKGQTFVVDSDAVVGDIRVERGGILVVSGDAPVHLSAKSITVYGKLQVGSEKCPLIKKATITLRGRSDDGVYNVNDPYGHAIGAHGKGLVVHSQGILDVHGRPHAVTWTRLAHTVSAGTQQLTLQEQVDWLVGQEVAMITTVYHDFNDQHHQNEVRRISAVSGRKITLHRPLSFLHYGGPEYSGEVALLSRSVLIQGDQYSDQYKYGGHTMCMKGSICRISYAEGFRLGQLNVMARYPFHLHTMGVVDSSLVYFKGCSVHRSFFRAYVVHATSGSQLLDNIAYDITGSAYYLEDGVEENNLIQGNLAAFVHVIKPRSYRDYGVGQTANVVNTVSERIVPTDLTAAGFYCTNTNNRWKNNAASGGFVGFLFPALPHALGTSYRTHRSYVPEVAPLREFDGNTAHSSGKHWSNGACIYVGGRLMMKDPASNVFDYKYDYGRTNTPDRGGNIRKGGVVFTNTKVYLCNIGLTFWGANSNIHPHLTLKGFNAIDTPKAGAQMLGLTAVTNGEFTAHTRNTASVSSLPANQRLPTAGGGARAVGLIMYDTAAQMIVTNVTFTNYNRQTGIRDACLKDLTHSNVFVPQWLASVKQIQLKNVAPQCRFFHHKRDGCPGGQQGACPKDCRGCQGSSLASLLANLLDEDGGLTGLQGGAVVGAADSLSDTGGMSNAWWQLDTSCKTATFGGFWACPRTPTIGNLKREIVSITISQGSGRPRDRFGQLAIPGTIYHFGQRSRKMQVGLGGNYQITGACCDIGWYFMADMLPAVFSIALTQMVTRGGQIMAIALPPRAAPVVKKCKGNSCRVLVVANTKQQFVSDRSTWPLVYIEGNTLFIRLVNEDNYYFQSDGGAKVLSNRAAGRHFYTVEHVGGAVTPAMKLPSQTWLKLA